MTWTACPHHAPALAAGHRYFAAWHYAGRPQWGPTCLYWQAVRAYHRWQCARWSRRQA